MSNLAEEKYPEQIIELVDVIVQMLVEKHNVNSVDAIVMAWDVANTIAIEWAGQQVYITTSVAVSERDREIVRDLDRGMAHGSVATKHAITERTVFNILRRVRAEEVARTQLTLPCCVD